MDKTLKKKWVKALRSGKYTQGTHYLKQESSDGKVRHCCLGVLAQVCPGKTEWRKVVPSKKHPKGTKVFYPKGVGWKKGNFLLSKFLDFHEQESLVFRNDTAKWGFNTIADYIEEHL